MNIPLKPNHLYRYLGWTFLGLLFLFLFIEGWRYGVKPSATQQDVIVESSLNSASQLFSDKQRELLDRTGSLVASLEPHLIRQQSFDRLYNLVERFPGFWSVTLYKGGTAVLWDGFAREHNGMQQNRRNQSDPNVRIQRHNNVLLLECAFPFSVQDSSGTTSYNLYTTYRIEQSNPLPIGKDTEYNLFQSPELKTEYPVHFSLTSTPSSNFLQQKPLTTLSGDSVGVVYATSEAFQQTLSKWESGTRFWRSFFALISFLALATILFLVADHLGRWSSLLLQLLLVISGWGIFQITDFHYTATLELLPENPGADITKTVRALSDFTLNSIFGLLLSVAVSRKLVGKVKELASTSYFSTIGATSAIGILNNLLLLYIIGICYQTSLTSGISFLDLQIYPQWSTIIFYLSLGASLLAVSIFLIALNRFIFKYARHQQRLSAAILVAAFFISLFIAQLFIPDWMVLNWVFYLTIGMFTAAFGIAWLFETNKSTVLSESYLRQVVLGSFLLALFGLPILYQTYLKNMENRLWDKASEYAQIEDPFAEELTKRILSSLEQEFRGVSQEALQDSQSTIQSRFTQAFQNIVKPDWQIYSFDLQLIEPTGNVIADYSTDLNSPDWVTIYDVSSLSSVIDIQQITRKSIRPIVQLPQLSNQEDYQTFYRGWIPIFGTPETPIAWILCSVYQERPQFEKPIRTVMASLNYDEWHTSYLMQEYQNGRLYRSSLQGFENHFPEYQQLRSSQLRALEEDTLIYTTSTESEHSYRTLLWKKSDQSIIKTSTTIANFRVILFSYFRFGFTLLLTGCLFLMLAKAIAWNRFHVMGRENRFQDRILDSFMLATLLFLGLLVITSQYAIKQKNIDIAQQELYDKLNQLTDAAQRNLQVEPRFRQNNSFALDVLTTQLKVDATYYYNWRMTESTTPQIYQQHLLPSTLPFRVYTDLFNEQKRETTATITLAGQKLLIGFRTVLDSDKNPVATIAIPTFLHSPKYEQQLLETTSYLILIYLCVFGLFILASTLISKQLTRPLTFIQRGLNKISQGNLNTTIPVKSNDEIGNLAKAYNQMVFRLKQLQSELAKAEREAAWKEMAQQVAHEIKNPLTPMKLNVQHLERQLSSNEHNPEELKKIIKKITANLIDQIQSLNNIASDFSKFAQPIEENFDEVNVNELLKSVSELYDHDEKVAITVDLPDKDITVSGVEDELKRVIINMIKNAYEAIPDEGQIAIRLFEQQHHAFIEIEDNGTGIREEDKPNIFVPNFSTKSSGTGLGLAISKKVIEAHHGSISFASVEEEGTTFIIKLPINSR